MTTLLTQLEIFLLARQAPLTEQFEAGNVDRILEFYDPDISFSDHGKRTQEN